MDSEGAEDRPTLLVLLRRVVLESQCVGRAGQRSPVHLELFFSFPLPLRVVVLLQACYFCS